VYTVQDDKNCAVFCTSVLVSIMLFKLLFVTFFVVSEFLAKESNELFWSFIEALTQFDLESPDCE